MSHDILLSLIDPDPDQPRKNFDAAKLEELAKSMQANGLAVPILLRPNGERFIIVHGERRYRAASSLAWETIPADVREISPENARWLALVENVQRADLSPIEEAIEFKARLDEGITQTALGERIGKSQSYIAQKLRLLTLPAPIQFYLSKDAITEGHARQLLKLRDIYGKGLNADFSHWEGRKGVNFAKELPEVEAWCIMSAGVLLGLRIEEQPPAGLGEWWDETGFPMHDPTWRTFSEACREFERYSYEHNRVIPQWEAAAFWWASISFLGRMSVDLLAKAVDGWKSRFYSAISYLCERPTPPPAEYPIQFMLWWGYKTDLRHSRAWECVTATDDNSSALRLRALEFVAAEGAEYLPSKCQGWGTEHERYQQLAAKMMN